MSTNSFISVIQKDNTVLTAYCHYDGYIAGVGAALLESYNDYDKALSLIQKGDMVSVGDYYDENAPDTRLFADISAYTQHLADNKNDTIEFAYCMDLNGKWNVLDVYHGKAFVELTQELVEQELQKMKAVIEATKRPQEPVPIVRFFNANGEQTNVIYAK